MPEFDPKLTRRCVLIAGAASMLPFGTLSAAAEPIVTVHRDRIAAVAWAGCSICRKPDLRYTESFNRCAISEVVISKEVVEGTTPPLYVYAARANDASA